MEVNVEVLDRPLYFKNLRTYDYEQSLTISSHFVDPYARAYVLESHAGALNTGNHSDTHIDLLIDKLRRAPGSDEFLKISHELQTYVAERMIYPTIAPSPFVQASRDHVKGYIFMRGLKVSFETTWLEKP